MWTVGKLQQHKLPYFLSTGTALGVFRHNGTIIPWDTDVDIAMDPKYEKDLVKIFKNNTVHYFERDPQGKRMYWVHHSKKGRPAGGPHVEIFLEPDYTRYPGKLYPLEPCALYKKPVMCPGRKMLNVWFPKGWDSYSGVHYHDACRSTDYRKGKQINLRTC